MKRPFIFLAVLLLALCMAGCAEEAVLGETYMYEVKTDIHSLDVEVGAADFTILPSDGFAVESNLKYLSVSEENGVLKIVEKKTVGVTYDGPVLTLYMPADMMFERIDIVTGAARLTADTLSAQRVKLRLGAGDVNISQLNAQTSVDIEGGAGQITIGGGSINDLELKMGAGELNLTAALLGRSELACGVGESNLILIGDPDDYAVEMEKGIGSITVDGITMTDPEGWGDGPNWVEIEGGVGAIHLAFQEP